jgi:hypothetical protein
LKVFVSFYLFVQTIFYFILFFIRFVHRPRGWAKEEEEEGKKPVVVAATGVERTRSKGHVISR